MSLEKDEPTPVADNRKALHDYFIEERFEAGIALSGCEVKSLREGRVNFRDCFARIDQGEIFLINCHISPYSHGNYANLDPTRTRKLLLKKREIERLWGQTRQKGLTLIPLSIYFRGGRAKVTLALARGKKLYDKRETDAKRSAKREIERGMRKKG